jgi:X-Pro dipeptidyl-peptidase
LSRARTVGATLLLLATALLAPGVASAAPSYTLGPDGTTAEAYSYSAALRERVYIPQFGTDQDADGVADVIAIEIIRPDTADPVPAIIDPSPYYTTVCRGNEGQCIGDTDADGVNDKWPLFIDNYFVPRGYAVILAESDGTSSSTGCPLHGGPGDVLGMRSVIDWLNGRVPGYSDAALTHATLASWHDGSSAMIGKSYDGTLTEGVAATGVSGLKAIVPESAIDDWYNYSRMGGIRFNTHYPAALSQAVTDAADQAHCAPSRAQLSLDDGDATGDRNVFWDARDYLKDVSHVTAAVLATHGLQDDNVRMAHLATWWAGLAADNVPRKLWLLRAGHVDPFDLRRDAWVDTLHKFFDHWLYGIANDVMTQPRVDIQDQDESWHTESDWPAPDTAPVDLHLRATTQADAGAMRLGAGDGPASVTWVNAPTQTETTMMNAPAGSQASRRVFLSAPLTHDLRISGTPVVHLIAALSTTQNNLGAILVDYGAATPVTRTGDGISTTTTSNCWGQQDTTKGDWTNCYKTVTQPTTTVTATQGWRVSSGILDSSNRDSLSTPSPVTSGTPAAFPITLVPQDYVFPAGHQVGVVVVGDYRSFPSVNGSAATTFTLDTLASTVALPVVGGAAAVARAGGFDTTTPTLTVPADVATTDPVVTWPAPAVGDDADPSPAVACDPASGSTFALGTTTVTCTATDASGNATPGTFTVTVTKTADPAPGNGGGGQTLGGTPAPAVPGPADQPAGPPAATPPVARPTTLDLVPLKLTRLTLSGRHRQVLATFTLSAAATITVTATRHGAKRATKTVTAKLKAGKRGVRLTAKTLKPGRYDVVLTARGADGVRHTTRRTLTVTAR